MGALRFDIVTFGNVAKFSQHPELAAHLRATGDAVLVEASPVDKVWGIGLSAGDANANDPTAWRGLNLLGFSLMRVRRILNKEEHAPGAPFHLGG